MRKLSVCYAVGVFTAVGGWARADLAVNGNFESSPPTTGWSFTGISGTTNVGGLHNNVGDVVDQPATIFQSFTVPTLGSYTISFDASSDQNFADDFGAIVATVSSSSLTKNTGVMGADWATYTFSGTLSSGSHTLTFTQAQPDPTGSASAFVDNVKITADAVTPEPASASLLVIAGGSVLLRRRSR